jgi:FkbM family methyltransferase
MDPSLLVTKNCRHGRINYLRTDTFIGRSLDLYGEWCEGEIILFSRLLQPGSVAIDVGANIGTHTLALAKLVGPAGAIHAFEPQQAIYDILCANIEGNGLRNVKTYLAAMGAKDGTCHVPKIDYSSPDNFGAVSVGQGEIEVPLVAIDGLNLARLDLVKIDVEGAESEVLAGATSTLARLRPMLYVENNQREKSKDLVALIRDMKYRLWWHISAYFNKFNFAGNSQNLWPRNIDANMICLPQEAVVPPWPLVEVRDGTEFSSLRLAVE